MGLFILVDILTIFKQVSIPLELNYLIYIIEKFPLFVDGLKSKLNNILLGNI